ncbi:MAG: helix-turn-helix transcriptional regulator [Dehalococcoidia bacterium]|nr:helix-turn-helix transcriptional regulator [Dehalococcoidia bacterium]
MRTKERIDAKGEKAMPSSHPSVLNTFAGAGDPTFAVDANGLIVLWNAAAEELLGYPAKEVVGRYCHEVVGGRDNSCHHFCGPGCSAKASVLKSQQVRNYDLLTAHKDGHDVWVNVSVIGVPDVKGVPRYTVHILRDVTEQHRSEQVLNDILKRLDGHITLTPSQEPTDASPPTPPHPTLSTREHQVLQLLAAGLGAKDIAKELQISHFTVRNHVQSILAKMGVHSTSQAIAHAYQNRLLDSPPL